MVLTKDELAAALNHEVRLLLHLASKADPATLEYRPPPRQRSTLEQLRYMVIMGPIHMRAVLAATFDMDAWRAAWRSGQASVKEMTLAQTQDEIAKQPALFADLLAATTDAQLREPYEMFGRTASRGSLLVSLVLSHYAAYRMQLFLYLKASGHPELNTMNLWVGVDGR